MPERRRIPIPKLSYRHKLRLQRALKALGITVLVLCAIMIFFLIFLQRYVVYTSDGAHLDFSRSTLDIAINEDNASGEKPNSGLSNVEIEIKNDEQSADGKLKQLSGVYITIDMIRNEPVQILENIKKLDNTNAVMIDVKDAKGNFYYNTSIADTKKANTDAVDELISYLTRNGYPMIARIPAFTDSYFAENNRELALEMDDGTLWSDEEGNYWLNPEKSTVISYQEQICKELSSLGFQEVVFDSFSFPASGSIVYTSNMTRAELITSAAREMENAFAGSNLTISFCTTDTAFPVDSAFGRIYIPDASGANVDRILSSLKDTVNNIATQVVFLSDSRDTRFEACGILRPLIMEASVDIDLPVDE